MREMKKKRIKKIGYRSNTGYLRIKVKKYGDKHRKSILIHRFICFWECLSNLIPEDKVIDHLNEEKTNNRLSILQLITQRENVKRSIKDRDSSYDEFNHENRKCDKAANCRTDRTVFFNSMNSIHQHLLIPDLFIKSVILLIIVKKEAVK